MHVRQQIRKACISALANLPTTGSRIYESRVYPLEQAELPGLMVYTPSEDSGREDSPTDSMRDVNVVVHGVAAISQKLEDELDDIALEVEKALDDLGEIGGLVKIYHGIQGTITSLSGEEAAKPHGAIEMIFQYTYRTKAGSPDTAV